MNAQLIPILGFVDRVSPANGTVFQLDELQKLVGGYVEFVPLPDGRHMVVDEDARLADKPWNGMASILAGRRIFGPAVVCDDSMIR